MDSVFPTCPWVSERCPKKYLLRALFRLSSKTTFRTPADEQRGRLTPNQDQSTTNATAHLLRHTAAHRASSIERSSVVGPFAEKAPLLQRPAMHELHRQASKCAFFASPRVLSHGARVRSGPFTSPVEEPTEGGDLPLRLFF